MSAAILIPILAQIGVPILKKLIGSKVKSDTGKVVIDSVVDTLAQKIGVEPTPEAIAKEYENRPEHTTAAIKEVEAENSDKFLEYLAPILAREDARESAFAWAWRPAMSWLVIFLFGWAMVLVPLLNAAFKSNIIAPPVDQIIQFAGIWLVIYGGGNTALRIFGDKK